MGEWEAVEFDKTSGSLLRLWIVPAPVAGIWAWSILENGELRRLEFDLNQQLLKEINHGRKS